MILPDGLFKIPRRERMVFKIPRRARFSKAHGVNAIFKIPRRMRVRAAKRPSERFGTQDDKVIARRRKRLERAGNVSEWRTVSLGERRYCAIVCFHAIAWSYRLLSGKAPRDAAEGVYRQA